MAFTTVNLCFCHYLIFTCTPTLEPTTKIIRPRLFSQILGLDGTVFSPTNLVEAKITGVKSLLNRPEKLSGVVVKVAPAKE
jgi:hypothetical protein